MRKKQFMGLRDLEQKINKRLGIYKKKTQIPDIPSVF